MLPSNRKPFQRIARELNPKAHITETHCPACGHLIAITPRPELLDLVENLHICPESLAFAFPNRSFSIKNLC